MDNAAIIAEASRWGIDLTGADFAPESCAEVSDDELNYVAGGGRCACAMGGGKCGCNVGGGTKGDNCNKCICMIAGGGTFEDGATRCLCQIGGGGVDK